MRFLYDNDFDSYTVTGSSAATNYPVTHTQDYQLEKTWRTATVSTSTLSIDVGSGLTITPTCGAFLEHNYSASVLAYIEGSSDNWSSVSTVATVAYAAGAMITYAVSGTLRYWRGRIVDPNNTDDYHSLGRLFIGTYLDWTVGMGIAFPKPIKDTSTIQFTRTGQSYGNVGHNFETYGIVFPLMTDTERQSIETMYNSVHRTKPILFVPDENNTDKLAPIYGTLDNCNISYAGFRYKWKGSLDFREVK